MIHCEIPPKVLLGNLLDLQERLEFARRVNRFRHRRHRGSSEAFLYTSALTSRGRCRSRDSLYHQRVHEFLVDAFGDLLAVIEQDFLHFNFATRRLGALNLYPELRVERRWRDRD